MSRASKLSNYEIRVEGWKALTERLGVAGAIRFLTEYDPGRGDYVEERRELFRDLTGGRYRSVPRWAGTGASPGRSSSMNDTMKTPAMYVTLRSVSAVAKPARSMR
jgi:hypothetical protein